MGLLVHNLQTTLILIKVHPLSSRRNWEEMVCFLLVIDVSFCSASQITFVDIYVFNKCEFLFLLTESSDVLLALRILMSVVSKSDTSTISLIVI